MNDAPEIADESFEDPQNDKVREGQTQSLPVSDSDPTSTLSAQLGQSTIDSVAIGNALIDYLQPQASYVRQKMEQVARHQEVLSESVANERGKLEGASALRELERTFVRVEQYRAKLAAIRQTMQSVRDRVERMRVRAVKLSNAKKAELERAQRAKQVEIERDKSIAPLVPDLIRERRTNSQGQSSTTSNAETDRA